MALLGVNLYIDSVKHNSTPQPITQILYSIANIKAAGESFDLQVSFVYDTGESALYPVSPQNHTLNIVRENLVLLVGGQSNCGTDPATGRVPYADMPTYLQTAPANVEWVNVVNSSFVVEPWSVDSTVQWGWLNQAIHLLKPQYPNGKLLCAKRGIGGTVLTPTKDDLSEYNRGDFKAKANHAISYADTNYGANNYDIVVLWNQGETNGAAQALADVYEQALTEWFAEIRVEVRANVQIVFNKMGIYQDVAFPFLEPTVRTAQDVVDALSADNVLISGFSGTKWELQDLIGDISHYNAPGAISLGTNFANQVVTTLGRTKVDATAPVLQSAVISDAARNQIVLTYDKTLNAAVKPFWYEFVLSDGRKVTTVAVSGMTVTLTVSEDYYSGITPTLTYNRSSVFEGNIQDLAGNVAAALVNQAVINNSTLAVPTYTNIYTSAFNTATSNLDGWVTFNGATLSVVDGIGGRNNVLRSQKNSDIPQTYKQNVFPGIVGEKYRVRISLYLPEEFYGTTGLNKFLQVKIGTSLVVINTDVYLRRMALDNQWVDFEFTHTCTATNQKHFYVNDAGGVVGSFFGITQVQVDKIN